MASSQENNVLLQTLSESAVAWKNYFLPLWMDRQLYDRHWLTRDFITSRNRQCKPSHVPAIVDGLVAAVSPFGNALQRLNSTLPLPMRVYQIAEDFREAVSAADDRGRREKNRVLEKKALQIAKELQENDTVDNQCLENLLRSSYDVLQYARSFAQSTFGLCNRTVCVEKVDHVWFNASQAELMATCLGCMGFTNQCLKSAESAFRSRSGIEEDMVDSTFPLLGEMGVDLIPLTALQWKLIVFFRSVEHLALLPAFSRCLERALTDYYEPKTVEDLNPLVRVTVDLDTDRYSCVIQFRERRGRLLYTLDVIFSYRAVLEIFPRSNYMINGSVAFANGLLLLRELFILKHIAAYPELRFGILLLMDLRRGVEGLRNRIEPWDLIGLLRTMSDIVPFQDLSTVIIRCFSVLELSEISCSACPDLAAQRSLNPFIFAFAESDRQNSTDKSESPGTLTTIGDFSFKLRQKKIADLFSLQPSAESRDLYLRGKKLIRDDLVREIQESLIASKNMNHDRPQRASLRSQPCSILHDSVLPPSPMSGSDVQPVKYEMAPRPEQVLPPVDGENLDPRLNRNPGNDYVFEFSPPTEHSGTPVGSREVNLVQSMLRDREMLLQLRNMTHGTQNLYASLPVPEVSEPALPADTIPSHYDASTNRSGSSLYDGLPLAEEHGGPEKIIPDCRNYLKMAYGSSDISGSEDQEMYRPDVSAALTDCSLSAVDDDRLKTRKRKDDGSLFGLIALQLEQPAAGYFSAQKSMPQPVEFPTEDGSSESPRKRLCNEFSSPVIKSEELTAPLLASEDLSSNHDTDDGETSSCTSSSSEDSQQVAPSRNIYVQNIHPSTTYGQLSDLFRRRSWPIERVFINPSKLHSRTQFAWVNFRTLADAEQAMNEMQDVVPMGRKLRLSYKGNTQAGQRHSNIPERFDIFLERTDRDVRPLDLHRFIETKWRWKVEDVLVVPRLKHAATYIQFAKSSEAKRFLEDSVFRYRGRTSIIEVAPNSERLRIGSS